MNTIFSNTLDYVWLGVGFGLVIFFHELGHFLAAKYCGVKVEQFAIGFGPAVFSWRKGIGLRWGSSGREAEVRQGGGETETGRDRIGETEYRVSWIPLGGYVKMLGQDDLRPGVTVDDPRSYNNKSVGARMFIVSAGVIMNIIVAAVGFMIVYMLGFPVPPARVGGVMSLSPAMHAVRADGTRAALQTGDEILSVGGKKTAGDFTKIQLAVALSREGATLPVVVRHLDGTTETLQIKPARPGDDPRGLLALGVLPPVQLAGLDPATIDDWDEALLQKTLTADSLALRPGEVITQINGQDVNVNEFWKLSDALAASDGKPVELTVRSADGKIAQRSILAHLIGPFGKQEMDFLGLVPRATVDGLQEESPALDKLKPGDAIVAVEAGTDLVSHPSPEQIRKTLSSAGEKQLPVTITVLSAGQTQPHQIVDLDKYIRISGGRMGLGILIGYDERHLVVAQVQPDSASADRIPQGATLLAIDGQKVDNWLQVRRIIAEGKPGSTLAISFIPPGQGGPGAAPAVAQVKLGEDDVRNAQMMGFTCDLRLRPMPGTMRTSNPLVAIGWGVRETRDSVQGLYLTLQRMFTGDVSVSNVMGPVGMFHAGAQLASRGLSWLVWFLSEISANLAVINFLPIPIMDGGLFTLLILEKIQGKPLSAEMQKIVQTVGLVLILGVFLLVTYQDIARWAGYAN
ncbi:MAG: site-2 protease family protein [Tepidisphaeraceae bacterium]|jgi:regulator of sigma E protease